ncbi:MAG: hypothetical protein EXS63_07520 [Candidatus Omnitrophica bacterium]|nr:hypothetical protein [Candidatus Omnitrophota bacterium]
MNFRKSKFALLFAPIFFFHSVIYANSLPDQKDPNSPSAATPVSEAPASSVTAPASAQTSTDFLGVRKSINSGNASSKTVSSPNVTSRPRTNFSTPPVFVTTAAHKERSAELNEKIKQLTEGAISMADFNVWQLSVRPISNGSGVQPSSLATTAANDTNQNAANPSTTSAGSVAPPSPATTTTNAANQNTTNTPAASTNAVNQNIPNTASVPTGAVMPPPSSTTVVATNAANQNTTNTPAASTNAVNQNIPNTASVPTGAVMPPPSSTTVVATNVANQNTTNTPPAATGSNVTTPVNSIAATPNNGNQNTASTASASTASNVTPANTAPAATPAAQPSQQTDAQGNILDFDASHQLTRITFDNKEFLTDIQRDSTGNILSGTYHNKDQSRAVIEKGKITQVITVDTSNPPRDKDTLSYDENGKLTKVVTQLGTIITYDAAGKAVKLKQNGGLTADIKETDPATGAIKNALVTSNSFLSGGVMAGLSAGQRELIGGILQSPASSKARVDFSSFFTNPVSFLYAKTTAWRTNTTVVIPLGAPDQRYISFLLQATTPGPKTVDIYFFKDNNINSENSVIGGLPQKVTLYLSQTEMTRVNVTLPIFKGTTINSIIISPADGIKVGSGGNSVYANQSTQSEAWVSATVPYETLKSVPSSILSSINSVLAKLKP